MRPVLLTLVLATAIVPACKGSSTGLSLSVPPDIAEKAAWYEIGAFRDASCASVGAMLGNGLPPGPTARLAYKPKSGTPAFGDIANGSYAFAAVARKDDCTVLARGCTDVDLSSVDIVHIRLAANNPESGACASGSTCDTGECAPTNDNADEGIGANCSLEVVGSGPLTTAAGPGTVLSAPAIVATTTTNPDGEEQAGFMIAYREINASGLGAKVTLLPIDAAGGAAAPLRLNLPNPCSSSDETDGVGLVVNDSGGYVTLAKAPCGGTPELQLLSYTSDFSPGKFLVTPTPSGSRVTLGAARSSVLLGATGFVAYAEAGAGRLGTLDPSNGIVAPNGSFGATTGVTDTWVAANGQVIALLAAVGAATPAPDPAPDDGGGGGDDPPPDPTDATELHLVIAPGNTPIAGFDAANQAPSTPIVFPGTWGSLAASAGRVIVLSDGTGPGRSVTYRTFDLGRADAVETGGFSIPGSSAVTAGDVAIVKDRAYFAVMKAGAIALHVYDGATTKLHALHHISFGDEPRISGVSTAKNGSIAVAATESRVAVVWTTTRVLARNDPTGFYAVLGCTP